MASPASATDEQHHRSDHRKGKADHETSDDSALPLITAAVIDWIVPSKGADHELCSFLSVPSGQFRLKVLPLAAGLGDSSRHGLGEVVSDHAARRCRTGGLPRIGVDQPPVLVEPRMSDPLRAVTDPGNLISGHVAP